MARVRIAHTSDDVITQFRDPHTPMIDFSHADKCCYSAAGTILFLGPLLQHYMSRQTLPEPLLLTALKTC